MDSETRRSFPRPTNMPMHTFEVLPDPEPPLVEPVAYHLRFTFSDQDKDLNCLQDSNFMARCKAIHKNLIDEFLNLDYIYESKYTSGFETQNKKGETCPAHFHLVFYSTKNSETMRRKVKRYLLEVYDQQVTGNKALMFKPQVVRSHSEFWRYPLKQSLKPDLCGGFGSVELQIMHECAKESYLKTVQINQAKADKSDSSDTLFARVMNKIQKSEPNDTISPRIIAKYFLDVYIEEDRPINLSTIKGYVLNASVKLGISSIDDIINTMGY